MEYKYDSHVKAMMAYVDGVSWETYFQGLTDIYFDAYAEGEKYPMAGVIEYCSKILTEKEV